MPPAIFSSVRQSLKRPAGRRQLRISAILRSFSHRGKPDPTIGDLSQAFDTRAFGAFFILFGGLNLVPLPPGASLFFGIPLLFFTFQLGMGFRRLWLPERIGSIRIGSDRIAAIVSKVGPPLRRIERLARHRYWPQPERLVLATIGWFSFVMAVLVAIPLPLTNLAPGVAIAIAGVAITARDGLWLIASFVLGIASAIFLAGVYGMAVLAVLQFT